ncbi:MAG: hypothetical protein FP818_01260 [Rhodocyclaceae bacterium]|nr:hypothetical protein [Rhodocyclaceae bacterium]
MDILVAPPIGHRAFVSPQANARILDQLFGDGVIGDDFIPGFRLGAKDAAVSLEQRLAVTFVDPLPGDRIFSVELQLDEAGMGISPPSAVGQSGDKRQEQQAAQKASGGCAHGGRRTAAAHITCRR